MVSAARAGGLAGRPRGLGSGGGNGVGRCGRGGCVPWRPRRRSCDFLPRTINSRAR
jgi:hypothetical protein